MSALNLKPPSPKGLTVPGTATKAIVPTSSLSAPAPPKESVQSTISDAPPWEGLSEFDPKPPINWAKGDSLDDVKAFRVPPQEVISKAIIEQPKIVAKEYILVEDEDEELAAALLMYDRMVEGKKRLAPKVLAQGSVREINSALAYAVKAGPHPVLQDAMVHLRLARDHFHEFLKTLEFN